MIKKLNALKNIRPHRFQKSVRSFCLLVFSLSTFVLVGQNKFQKQLSAQHIEFISINGNQIFNISVTTSKTDDISVTSTLDGEYQNDFQMVIKEDKSTLNLSLEQLSFEAIPDDKRNAHKVIAATLHLEIPEQLKLQILSDVGSVNLIGTFKSLFVELKQGQCKVKGDVKTATINTLDGDITIWTKSANVEASSNHGKVILDEFSMSNSTWNLTSINGNITVVKTD
ncbi:MAG: hypothetical protein AB8B52_06430 [Winogradskyella sp.]|uniref:hypothetical protein n=1 Tax=Winogradskyella sp. TaxID=1883156 RepID=UPI00385A5B07